MDGLTGLAHDVSFVKCNFLRDNCVMRINFDFGDLEAFLAVAEFGSFQRAAEALNLSQPALSRRIQRLEASLGARLFDRTTRSVKPTLAGRRLRARAQAMVDDAAETMLALRDETLDGALRRNAIVTLAVVPSVAQTLLTSAIRRFRAAGHSARIRILDRLANDVADAVAEGDADFGVSSIPDLERSLAFEPFADDRIVLAMPRGHPLAEREAIRWNALAGLDVIAPIKGTGNRALIDEALARNRQRLAWSVEVRRTTTALGLVAAGIGVAVMPESAVAGSPEGPLVSRPLTAPAVTRSIGIVRRGAQALHPPAETMRAMIVGDGGGR